MNSKELRERRRALGLTQATFAVRINLSRHYVGQMERGVAAVAPHIAAAVTALRPDFSAITGRLRDPMERILEEALIDAHVAFRREDAQRDDKHLDLYLPDLDTYIEVKRMHTPRVSDRMARVPNVIVAQGEAAVRTLATAIRRRLFAV